MGMRWNIFRFWLRIYVCLIALWGIQECCSLNDEGIALLEFRARITSDPYFALANWNPNDCDPCKWFGVRCVDGKVQTLDLKGLSLEGILAPELGKLSHLKSLILRKNNFSGAIPEELGDLAKLELLDLRENNLSGIIPTEIVRLLCNNNNECGGSQYDNDGGCSQYDDEGGGSQYDGEFRFKSLLVANFSEPLTTLVACINRKFGHCVWKSNLKEWNEPDSTVNQIKVTIANYLSAVVLQLFKLGKHTLDGNEENCCDLLTDSNEIDNVENVPDLDNSARRKLLDQSSNLAAAPYSGEANIGISTDPVTQSSGGFPAVPAAKEEQNQAPPPPQLQPPSDPKSDASSSANKPSQQPHSDNGSSGNWRKYLLIIALVIVLVIVIIIIICIWRKRAVKVIKPWKTGISGQLQRAFITGVPKLNRDELETACEDFSNIVSTKYDECIIYKGTLSSGVEIAVVSTVIKSAQDWSKNTELNYRRKIDSLSRVNHKNFVNLIGYCEEEEPFTRMMVLEYAPNGCLFEHLHVREVERLKWSERMRIIMGTAYCLQYMHHDLNPPVTHTDLNAHSIFLTDDFAAKIAQTTFRNIVTRSEANKERRKKSELPPHDDPETNVYCFGVLLLEIVSGRLPHSVEQGSLVDWAAGYLNDKGSFKYLIDPTLQSVKDNELDVICEVVKECIQPDPRLRPTMREIAIKLREALRISPEQAVPRLSPLWWAELEILSVEAT
ncbi:protein MALE DISCOVERER 2-like isoform X2 [Arachis duranensis]|uniref:Protein MALE DISCOVERER 2-like isoform X2 n=1 Tax=Arachis duranensis TaxID=130453 RepID=A0A6P5MWM1_ARADU|nr:protein MALE DISCOVERER 2-like isoform X2 [Arachis duranensis]